MSSALVSASLPKTLRDTACVQRDVPMLIETLIVVVDIPTMSTMARGRKLEWSTTGSQVSQRTGLDRALAGLPDRTPL